MATPPGPATPGNPISFDDIRNLVNYVPNVDVAIKDIITYQYNDGIVNDYTFYGAYYPVSTSPSGGAGTLNANVGMFYDIESDTGIDINFSSGSPAWVNDIDCSFTDATFLGSYSQAGPNLVNNVQFFTIPYGTQGGNIPHWYQVDIQVGLNPVIPPPPPPFANVNIEYDNGGGWTAFPGSPFNNAGSYTSGSISTPTNGNTLYVRVY